MKAVIMAALFCAACIWCMARAAKENLKWYVPYVLICFLLWLAWFLLH